MSLYRWVFPPPPQKKRPEMRISGDSFYRIWGNFVAPQFRGRGFLSSFNEQTVFFQAGGATTNCTLPKTNIAPANGWLEY